jgi:MFS family permease
MDQTQPNPDQETTPIVSMSEIPVLSYKVFFICLIGVTFANLDHSIFILVSEKFQNEFGWTLTDVGWYVALTFFISGLICTQIGVLTDRIGRKKSLLLSTFLTPVFVAYLAIAPNTIAGAQSPITLTTVTESSPPRFRGLFTGILQIGFPLGWFFASILVAFMIDQLGINWRYTFLLALLFLPYGWIIHKYLPESKAWLAAQNKKTDDQPSPSTMILFTKEWRRKSLLLFSGQFLYAFAYGSTLMLVLYFTQERGWDIVDAIKIVGYSYGIGAFGYIAAAIVGEFLLIRRNTIILWALLGSIAFIFLIWWADSWTQVLVVYGLMTLFFYGAYAVMATFIAENFPAELRATAASFSGTLAINLGFGLGPLAITYAATSFGWNMGYTYVGIIPIILAALIFLLLKPVPREDVF